MVPLIPTFSPQAGRRRRKGETALLAAQSSISHFNQPAVRGHNFAISPRLAREFYRKRPALEIRGRRECRALDAPAAACGV
jgi:hypothetical protein